MRVDSRTVLKSYDGEDLTYPSQINGKTINLPLTIKDAIIIAINQPYPQEVKTADMISKITGLSVKLYENHEVNLGDTERVFIKERMMMAVSYGIWQPIVHLRFEELFSEKEKEAAPAESQTN